jgi:hypothetical protein
MVISQIPNVYCPLKRFLNSSYFEYRLTQHCIIIFLNCREQTKEKYKKNLLMVHARSFLLFCLDSFQLPWRTPPRVITRSTLVRLKIPSFEIAKFVSRMFCHGALKASPSRV